MKEIPITPPFHGSLSVSRLTFRPFVGMKRRESFKRKYFVCNEVISTRSIFCFVVTHIFRFWYTVDFFSATVRALIKISSLLWITGTHGGVEAWRFLDYGIPHNSRKIIPNQCALSLKKKTVWGCILSLHYTIGMRARRIWKRREN